MHSSQECKQNFFIAQKINPVEFVTKLFKRFPLSMERELKLAIVLNHLHAQEHYLQDFGALSKRDASLPKDWSLTQKLNYILKSRQTFFARPVLTMHPTEVLSEVALSDIQHLVRDVLLLQSQTSVTPLTLQLEKNIFRMIEKLMNHSLIPEQNLTPLEEMQRQDRLYLDMMEGWSSFNRDNIQAFAMHHQVSIDVIREILTEANRYSYQNVASWSVADIDGNKQRNKKTMQHMERSLQLAIVERYLLRLEPLLSQLPKLKSVSQYLLRCRQAIRDGIYFNLSGAGIAKKRLVAFLEEMLTQDHVLSFAQTRSLRQFKDFVELVGFRGELKQFVRQSSQVNADVFQNFVTIFQQHFSEIRALHQQYGVYREWPLKIKMQLHQLIRLDSKYFKILKVHQDKLSADTIRELEILDFVLEYQDQFSYILSDTEHYQSLDEVIILFGFAAYIKDKLYIDGIRKPPVQLIPLCETPKDLTNLVNILDAMLSNPYLKQVIIEKGEIVYVAGPSDLGKEGGIFAHIDLIEAEKNAQKILEKHQKQDPHLAHVSLRVLYGLGTDIHRRVSNAFSQLFCTFQGSDACALAEYNSYRAYVERVSGKRSENSLRAKQLAELELNHTEVYQALKYLVELNIKAYREFILHPASLDLFRQITIPYHLGALTNKSSRGESKTSIPKDVVKSRAIGIVNYDIASLFFMRIFMGADALVDLPKAIVVHLPYLYEHVLVIKEQVLKILFAIAVSDEQIPRDKIFGEVMNQESLNILARHFKNPAIIASAKTPKHALAYAICRMSEILNAVSLFFPIEMQQKLQTYLSENSHLCASEKALAMMIQLGTFEPIFLKLHQEIIEDLRPRYQRLAKCIKHYESSIGKCTEVELCKLEENVVLALRGDRRVSAGPRVIAELSLDKYESPVMKASMGLRSKL